VNQDADEWHLLLLWYRYGNLYTLSEHVAPPLTYDHVVRYLKQELGALEDALAETLAWYRVARPSHPGYANRAKELALAGSS